MSNEENSGQVEELEVSNVEEGVSSEDLQALVSDTFDNNEFEATAESPEKDDDWDLSLADNINEKENQEDEKEEQPKADSEQKDKSEDAEESQEEVKDSPEGGEEPKEEVEQSPSALEVKIDGEIQELTLEQIKEEHPEVLEDLKSGISGAKASAKRFSELDAEKKSFYAEKKQIENYVAKFAETTKDGNVLGGLTYFAEFANIPPYLLKEQLIASLRPEIDKRSQMSTDQINNMRLRDENEYLSKKNESDTQKWQEEQTKQAQQAKQMELNSQINSIRETHKIDDEEWDNAYSELDKTLPPEVEVIPLKAIEEHILSNRSEKALDQRLNTLVSPVSEQVNNDFVQELRQLMVNNPGLSDEAVNTVIKDSLKMREKRELEKNLKQKNLEKPKKLVENNDNTSFKDLQDLIDWD